MSIRISEKLAPFVRDGELAEEWAASQKIMPEGRLPFLLPESAAENARRAGFDADAIRFLQKAADHIAADPDLARLICCTSWFLDPVYQDLLPSRSNIVRFQRECYLFPYLSRGDRSGLDRIFGKYVHDLSTAPRDSSMRRAVLDHLNSGGALVGGGCLIFPETLDWGAQVHLRQAAAQP